MNKEDIDYLVDKLGTELAIILHSGPSTDDQLVMKLEEIEQRIKNLEDKMTAVGDKVAVRQAFLRK